MVGEEPLGQIKSLPILDTGFYIQSDELELWRIANDISGFFNVNVLVYPDLKDKKVSCDLRGLTLEKSLDLVSWLAGVEWYLKDNNYYIGGNKDYIEVLDNTGIDLSLTSVFGNSNVKIVEDKIIISGTEREVKRISDAVKQLQKKANCSIHVVGYEVSEDRLIRLGVDLSHSIKYGVSWDNLIASGGNPVQSLAMSLAASVKAEQSGDDLRLLMSTNLTCISGKSQYLFIGDAVDRVINSTNEQGNVYTAGFSTVSTGYRVEVKGYLYEGEDWIFDFFIKNSNASDQYHRSELEVKNTVLLKIGAGALIGRIIKKMETVKEEKGIPFLCEVPYFGYLFKVSEEREIRRHVLFFVERVGDSVADAGATAPPGATRAQPLNLSRWSDSVRSLKL